jgi:hypothetical protein
MKNIPKIIDNKTICTKIYDFQSSLDLSDFTKYIKNDFLKLLNNDWNDMNVYFDPDDNKCCKILLLKKSQIVNGIPITLNIYKVILTTGWYR